MLTRVLFRLTGALCRLTGIAHMARMFRDPYEPCELEVLNRK